MNDVWTLLLASHYCGRWRGTEFRVAYSLYVFIALLALPIATRSPVIALTFLLLPITVLIHEIARLLTARHFDVDTETITIHAFGGAAQMADVITEWRAEILIALSAPMANLLICAGCFAALFVGANFIHPVPKVFLLAFGWQNLVLAIFTLLPIFPLAGGRIILAICVFFTKCSERALKIFRPIHFIGIAILALYGAYQMMFGGSFGLLLLAVALMLWMNSASANQMEDHIYQYLANVVSGGSDFYHFRDPEIAEESQPGFWQRLLATKREERDGNASEITKELQPNFLQRLSAARREKRDSKNKVAREELDRQVDQLLARISEQGIGNLSTKERALLLKASQTYRRDGEK